MTGFGVLCGGTGSAGLFWLYSKPLKEQSLQRKEEEVKRIKR